MPLVMKLKSRLLATAAAVITVKARASITGVSTTFALPPLRFAGASVSRGQASAKSRPQAIETIPGMANAARQPIHLTRKPVTSAATAMPRLPARPLMPITAPGFFTCCTSMGMPTGW
ncbi:hypothetical protein D3C83_14800 [compost metagenome]